MRKWHYLKIHYLTKVRNVRSMELQVSTFNNALRSADLCPWPTWNGEDCFLKLMNVVQHLLIYLLHLFCLSSVPPLNNFDSWARSRALTKVTPTKNGNVGDVLRQYFSDCLNSSKDENKIKNKCLTFEAWGYCIFGYKIRRTLNIKNHNNNILICPYLLNSFFFTTVRCAYRYWFRQPLHCGVAAPTSMI